MQMNNIKTGDRLIVRSRAEHSRHQYWRFQVVAILEHKGERRWLCVKLGVWPLNHFQLTIFDERGEEAEGFHLDMWDFQWYAGERSRATRSLLAEDA